MARDEGSWLELVVGIAAGIVLGGLALAVVFWILGAVVSFVVWMVRIGVVVLIGFFVLSLFLRGKERSSG